MCALVIKNTFLHVFDDCSVSKSNYSYPPTPRDQGVCVLQLAPLDTSVFAQGHSHDGAAVKPDTTQDLCENAHLTGEDNRDKKQRRRATRPCKGRRVRYAKLVAWLCEQVEEDPTSFKLIDAMIPPSVITNRARRHLLHAQVHWYRQQLLTGNKPMKVPKEIGQLVTECPCKLCGECNIGEMLSEVRPNIFRRRVA